MFKKTGHVYNTKVPYSKPRWPEEVYKHVKAYVSEHPCFYLEELQRSLHDAFPNLQNTSIPTLCRALRHDLGFTRKRIEKAAREAVPQELEDFKYRLRPFYNFPEQLVFVDETSKDGRDAHRHYGWSHIGTPSIVSLPFSRGKRISALAAFNSKGFFAWKHTAGTFTRKIFHDAFVEKVLPHLNPWPMPNSIVILDNARIHMYHELEQAIESRGAILLFLPPYSPHLNPIETGFSLVKRFIQREGNLAFHHCPEPVLDLAFGLSAAEEGLAVNIVQHSGYDQQVLNFR